MLDFSPKNIVKTLMDIVLIICGVIWIFALFKFANGTMDTTMEAEAVTIYQLKALAVLIVTNIIMVVLFKGRKKIVEKMEEDAGK